MFIHSELLEGSFQNEPMCQAGLWHPKHGFTTNVDGRSPPECNSGLGFHHLFHVGFPFNRVAAADFFVGVLEGSVARMTETRGSFGLVLRRMTASGAKLCSLPDVMDSIYIYIYIWGRPFWCERKT